MIVCKTPAQIATMQRNSQLLVSAIHEIEPLFSRDISTREIDEAVSRKIQAVAGVPAFKGYHGFPCASCPNINEEVTNAVPSERKLRDGDLLKLQVGMIVYGYRFRHRLRGLSPD